MLHQAVEMFEVKMVGLARNSKSKDLTGSMFFINPTPTEYRGNVIRYRYGHVKPTTPERPAQTHPSNHNNIPRFTASPPLPAMDYSSPVSPVRLQCYPSEPPHILAEDLTAVQSAPVASVGSIADSMLVGSMARVRQ